MMSGALAAISDGEVKAVTMSGLAKKSWKLPRSLKSS